MTGISQRGVQYIYIYKYIYTIAIFKNEIYLNKLWDWYKYGLPFFSCAIFCLAFPSWMRNDPRITLWLDWVLEHLILWTSHCYFRQTVKKDQLAKLKVFEYMLLQHDFFLCDHFPDVAVSRFHLLCSSHIEKGVPLKRLSHSGFPVYFYWYLFIKTFYCYLSRFWEVSCKCT